MKMFQFPPSKNLFTSLLACTAILCFAAHAQAASIAFNFPLTASEQVPPNGSAGTGNCNVVLDDVTGAVSVSCAFSGLSTSATAAHIHGLAAAGTNAGVILALTPDLATSGNITGNGALDAAQMTGMLDGLTYVNLHSEQFPGGELRGQVRNTSRSTGASSIPALSTTFLIAMFVLLLIAGGFALRKRSI